MLCIFITACAAPKPQAGDDRNGRLGTLLMFHEMLPGESERMVRYLVTDRFIRIDEGGGSPDYVLYDDEKQTIYNVVASDRSVLVMKHNANQAVTQKPQWKISSEASQLPIRNKVGSSKAEYIQLSINGKTCVHAVAMKDLIPEAGAILQRYYRLLGHNLANTYSEDDIQQQHCDWAETTSGAELVFNDGFPVRYWTSGNKQRFLVDFTPKIKFDPDVMKIPEGFETYGLE